MKKLLFTAICLLILDLTVVAQSRSKGPVHLPIFQQTPILFNPSDYPDGVTEKNGLIYLGNGRIVLKKINLPRFNNYTEAEIGVTLVSNGDPWDKSGSCFVIPRASKITMIDIARNSAVYPQQDTIKYEQLKGIVQGKDYLF